MSLMLDPSKLKVTELREELQNRGLDTKGNKPVLVKRLKKALEEELDRELPDTSIADTSTEDLDSSQAGEDKGVDESDNPIRKESLDSRASQELESEADQSVNNDDPEEETQGSVTNDTENEMKTNGEEKETEQDNGGLENSESEKVTSENVETMETTEENEQKGEKRKRNESTSEPANKKREKSPIKEDEPEMDPEKVLLSWYDSDLNLLVDKQSFLNAKPIHEGLFGYAWAGVRTTHGISSGKARYEVKITEELKWEDFTNQRKERQEKLKEAKQRREREKELMQAKLKKENAKSNDEQVKKEPEEEKEDSAATTTDTKVKIEVKMEVNDEPSNQADTVVESIEVKKEPENENEEDKEPEKQEEEKVQEEVKEEPSKPEEPILTHIFRTGWSLPKVRLQLGEDNFSYGYESTGKFVSNNEFKDFAVSYKLGDVVGAYLNVTPENIDMKFTVNGELQPETVSIPRSELPQDDLVMFPHVLTRNLAFELNLGTKEEPWFPNPEELADYPFVQEVEDKVQGPTRPEKREECEVLMMCGLPGSGKTHWVKEYVKSNEDKQITVIGSSYLLDRMTVRGQPLKSSYNGRWTILMDKLQRCLNRLSDIAQLRRRNYILDQTNVFPSAQRRKLRAFEGFKRRAVVVVVGDEEQAKRQSLKEAQDGKDVPDDAILEMKANMVLPTKGELFDEVIFTDLNEEEAKAQITKYNNEGKAAGYQPGLRKPPQGYSDIRGQWNYKRNDYHRGGNFRDNRFHRYDRGPRGWGQPPPPGRYPPGGRRPPPPPMAGGRDWRNNRGPPMRQGVMDRNGRPPASNYNRNRQQQASTGRSGGWQSGGGGYGGQGGWSGGQQQQSGWGTGGNQGWGGGGGAYQQQGGWNQQNQWQKYGGQQQNSGYGAAASTGQQQSYGQNWNNYYGQYAQGWTGQSYQ